LAAWFNDRLDASLDALGASSAVRAAVDVQRAKLAGADVSAFDPAMRSVLRDALARAYVAGFRATMLTCAALCTLGALLAAKFLKRH
jgi:hypothetical protein